MDTTAGTIARDARVTGVVGVAHFTSHFFQIVLPPLFPLLKDHWQVSYTELGLMMTLMYAASGLAQTPAGFLVDRFGAPRILAVGLALQVVPLGLVGFMPSFWLVLPLLVISGIGNSVYHPADFSIMSGAVTPTRMARAYSIHSLAGIVGWAVAPLVMLALTALYSWQVALAIVALGGVIVAILVLAHHDLLQSREPKVREEAAQAPAASLLLSAPILTCFVYFTLLSVSLTGLQTFLPTTLVQLYGIDIGAAGVALTAYLVANALGNVAGGVWADRTEAHERIVAIGLGLAALALLAIGCLPLGWLALLAAVSIAGFLSGVTVPARDMLVRSAAPSGATGKVFGFVYSGLDLGAAIAPLILGILLDDDAPAMVMVVAAVSLGLTIFSALLLKAKSPLPAPG